VKCRTIINQETGDICGHSITAHDGDESGMGGAEPCGYTHCPCNNFTREEEPLKGYTLPPMGQIMQGGPHVMKVDGGMVLVTTTIQYIPDSTTPGTEPADLGLDSAGTETLGDYD
jgi:hypothetical protein